jgi:hypothetical protein
MPQLVSRSKASQEVAFASRIWWKAAAICRLWLILRGTDCVASYQDTLCCLYYGDTVCFFQCLQ